MAHRGNYCSAERAAEMPVDVLIHLPAQTMADIAAGRSILTMGTHYEVSLLLFGDLLVLRLLELTNQNRKTCTRDIPT